MKWWQWCMVALALGVLLTAQVAVKHQLLQEDIGYVNCHQYGAASTQATVIACLAALAGNNRTAFLSPGTWTFSSNVVVPSTARLFIPNGTTIVLTGTAALTVQGPLRIEQGGSICPGSTASVTATGQLDFGKYQVFCSGAGAVSFNGNGQAAVVYPQWWGAQFVGGGRTAVTSNDCSLAIQAAVNALPAEGGDVVLGSGACLMKTTVTIAKHAVIRGYGSTSIILQTFGTTAPAANVASTILVKSSTLNGPAFQVGNHAGLNYLASHSVLRDFAIVGQTGNGGEGIVVLDHNVTISNVSAHAMGTDGIRVGTDSGPRCDCNLWVIENVVAHENGRDGIRIKHWVDGNSPDANGGTMTHVDVAYNAIGVNFVNTWLNHIYSVIASGNVSYGIVFGQAALFNSVYGADVSEGNCTGGCSPSPGDILFEGGALPARLNGVYGTTVFENRIIDNVGMGTSNTYTSLKNALTGQTLHGLLSVGFANTTLNAALPSKTYFSARSGSATLTFPSIAAGGSASQTMTIPDFTGPLKTCACDAAGDFGSGVTWNVWAVDGGCSVGMYNHAGSAVTPPAVLWRCVGLLFPVVP